MNVLYVSPAGNDGWSGRLPEANAEKTDGPLATLAGARDAVRRLKRAGRLQHGFTVYLRGGRYAMTQSVRFGPEDSSGVCYANQPGERPVMDGSVLVSDWQATTVNGVVAWVADVSTILRRFPRQPRSLFVNGERRLRPSLPREGRFQIEDVPGNTVHSQLFDGVTSFVTAPGDLQEYKNLQDIEALVNHFWVEERMPLVGWNPLTRLLESSRKSIFCLKAAFGPEWATYRLENVFEALKEPGEWYVDRPAGRLYYVPMAGETVETCEIRLPVLTQLIVVQGDPAAGKYAEFICFRGLHLIHTDWEQVQGNVPEHNQKEVTPGVLLASDAQAAESCPGVFQLDGARNIAIEDCTIAHGGFYGISADHCRGLRIVGNHLHDLGGGGVKLRGTDANGPKELRSGEHRVSDNHIHHIGEVFKAAIGIIGTHVYATAIIHNHIHDTHYSGISVGWVWGYAPSVSCDNTIAYNHIHNIGRKVLSDMGAIYTLGVQPGTTIHHNLIHDVVTLHYGGWGIYPDEGSGHMVIENNVVFNTQESCLFVHYSRELIVRNNIFVGGKHSTISLGRSESHNSFTLTGNILVTDGGVLHHVGYASSAMKPTFLADHNLVWDLSSKTPHGTVVPGEKKTTITLAELRQAGTEAHSLVADPGFVPATHYAFALSADSPAHPMGFRAIDLSQVGPRVAEKRD